MDGRYGNIVLGSRLCIGDDEIRSGYFGAEDVVQRNGMVGFWFYNARTAWSDYFRQQ